MAKIVSKVVYETDGIQFDSYAKAIQHREDIVVLLLQKLPGFLDIPLKKRVAFIEELLAARHQFIDALDYGHPDENIATENDCSEYGDNDE